MGEGELDRILANVVGNATRHARRVDLSVARREGRGVITVVDDGPGIPVRTGSACSSGSPASTRHGTGTRAGQGSGLAIVKELVRVRGGELRLGDEDGGGLRVEVELPEAAP